MTEPLTLELPDVMSDDLVEILGRPNFTCIRFALLLRADGQSIPRKAEAEQSAVIYWMLRLYAKHGATWRQALSDEIDRMIVLAKA